ncbi:MAG TPA: universal stress protein [Gaiellaceae bacterium]
MSSAGAIVVGYDGAEISQRALARAIDEARTRSAKLVVVAVAEMPLDPEGLQNYGTLDDSPVQMMPLVEPAELEPVLADARKRIEAAGLDADYVWAAGEPAGEILGVAKEQRASLIVIGEHHHGFFGRLLGADVSGEVQRDAGCEVIAVP